MKVIELVDKLQLKVFTGKAGLENEITGGYVSDLLSDVMGHAAEGNAWLTLQNHLNVVAIASLRDLACVILVKNIVPPADVIQKAIEEDVALLGSSEQTFDLSGKLYSILV
jgi:serine kinase of HPr protein (carbohydrate metabolism regulator)